MLPRIQVNHLRPTKTILSRPRRIFCYSHLCSRAFHRYFGRRRYSFLAAFVKETAFATTHHRFFHRAPEGRTYRVSRRLYSERHELPRPGAPAIRAAFVRRVAGNNPPQTAAEFGRSSAGITLTGNSHQIPRHPPMRRIRILFRRLTGSERGRGVH